MIATQLSWGATAALAWVIFGGIFLAIELSEFWYKRDVSPIIYRNSLKYRRTRAYLMFGFVVYLFGAVIILNRIGVF